MYITHETYVRREFRYRIKQVILLMLILNLIMFSLVAAIYMEQHKIQVDIMKSITYTNLQVEQIKKFEQQQLLNNNLKGLEEKSDVANVKSNITFNLSAADKELITRVCMAEAGANYEGCLAVAQCIHDRAVLWSKDPITIVTAYKQFAPPRQGEIYPESLQAVIDVFDNGKKAFNASNATHFFSGDDIPYWVEGKTYVGERGGNKFYI